TISKTLNELDEDEKLKPALNTLNKLDENQKNIQEKEEAILELSSPKEKEDFIKNTLENSKANEKVAESLDILDALDENVRLIKDKEEEIKHAKKSLENKEENTLDKKIEDRVDEAYNKQVEDLLNQQKVELEKMKYENLKEEEILNLAKKNALLSFYKNKLSNKNLSKKAFNIIKELERDIANASNEANKNLQEKLKHSLLVSSLLSKKANTFHLIKAYEELEKNLNFLQLSRFGGEEIKKIESRLKNNQVLIKNLLEDSFIYLENDLKNKVQLSLVKEYEKVSQFLNKNNEEEVKKLYALLETKQEKSEKVGVGGSKKIKEVKKENILKND
ncbi:hypothetical protein MG150_001742, partial [Campylobacter upsaliensis]|nr:hypothetical protein [Campylobacter upsaliensis]